MPAYIDGEKVSQILHRLTIAKRTLGAANMSGDMESMLNDAQMMVKPFFEVVLDLSNEYVLKPSATIYVRRPSRRERTLR